MTRWITTLLGFVAVALAIGVVVHGFQPPKAIGHDPNARDGAADAEEAEGGSAPATLGGGRRVPDEDSGEAPWSEPMDLAGRGDGGATGPGALIEGMPVPPLPVNAPRSVRFGVTLVSFAGTQPSAGGGRPSKRTKPEARALADGLVQTAREDFHAAVQQGDVGSSDDVGRVKIGILEPAPEYILFTLPVGNVGGPVETPRGYWIVKRLE